MAMPRLQYLGSVVVLENASVVPYPIEYQASQTLTRTSDGKIKVYNHPLSGDAKRKRIWRVRTIMDNDRPFAQRWSDLEEFVCENVQYAKYQCTYVDAQDNSYTVRIIGFSPQVKAGNATNRVMVVDLILEEDFT